MACLFTFVAREEEYSERKNWLFAAQINDGDYFEVQYVTALYWAFMTMTTVGYGDVVPQNSNERIVTIMMMAISTGIFAWLMGYIGSIIEVKDAAT